MGAGAEALSVATIEAALLAETTGAACAADGAAACKVGTLISGTPALKTAGAGLAVDSGDGPWPATVAEARGGGPAAYAAWAAAAATARSRSFLPGASPAQAPG